MQKLDCGHEPTQTEIGLGNGVARDTHDRTMCYACADAMIREDMRTSDRIVLYLRDRDLTSWSGGKLATVTARVTRRVGFHGSSRVYFDAIDLDGRHWHGNSPGDGMYARLHARKGNR